MPKMTSKGQVTIPKKIREYLGLKPGSIVEFKYAGDGEIKLKTYEQKHIPDVFGQFRGSVDLGMTTDEFMRFLRGDPEV